MRVCGNIARQRSLVIKVRPQRSPVGLVGHDGTKGANRLRANLCDRRPQFAGTQSTICWHFHYQFSIIRPKLEVPFDLEPPSLFPVTRTWSRGNEGVPQIVVDLKLKDRAHFGDSMASQRDQYPISWTHFEERVPGSRPAMSTQRVAFEVIPSLGWPTDRYALTTEPVLPQSRIAMLLTSDLPERPRHCAPACRLTLARRRRERRERCIR